MTMQKLELKDLTEDTIYTITYKEAIYDMCLTGLYTVGGLVEGNFVNINAALYDPMATLILGSADSNIKDGTVYIQEYYERNNVEDVINFNSVHQTLDPTAELGNISSSLFYSLSNEIDITKLYPQPQPFFIKFGGKAIPNRKLFNGLTVWMVEDLSVTPVRVVRVLHDGNVMVGTKGDYTDITLVVRPTAKFYKRYKHAHACMKHNLEKYLYKPKKLGDKEITYIKMGCDIDGDFTMDGHYFNLVTGEGVSTLNDSTVMSNCRKSVLPLPITPRVTK